MTRPRTLHDPRTEGAIWTVGHSTQSLPGFLVVLRAHPIETIADVGRFPGCRRHSQFAAEALRSSLSAHRTAYEWLPALGGHRRPDLDVSPIVGATDLSAHRLAAPARVALHRTWG